MTDDLVRYGTVGGAYAGNPEQIASLFEKWDVRLVSDGPWEITYLGDRKERWPRALDYISHYVGLFRQWAYRRADGERVLLQEVDGYIGDLYEWLKKGREDGRLDDIELARLKAAKEALTEKLREYVPERLIAGGLASIEQLLADIENTEHVTKYPPGPSPKWYDAEIVRLCLLAEKIKLLSRLVKKVHPENADKYHYLYCLGEVVGDIASYTGVLERSRDELCSKAGTGKIDIEEHLSKIDRDIENARGRIDNHLADLRERLSTSKAGETVPGAEPMDARWSRPMPLTDLADRILKDPKKHRKLKSVYVDRLKKVGDKSWMILLDGLPPNIIKELERP